MIWMRAGPVNEELQTKTVASWSIGILSAIAILAGDDDAVFDEKSGGDGGEPVPGLTEPDH
jgi:hypothetical protein